MVKALFLGSIGTLAETSEIQRNAYNQAFEEHGIDWYWNIANYCDLLKRPGGRERLKRFSNGELSAETINSIHARKEELFKEKLGGSIKPRHGLIECIKFCRQKNIKVGFITTTSIKNINSLKTALLPYIDINDFDLITNRNDVKKEKPNSEVYRFALSKLKLKPSETIAVEDTEVNQQAALEQRILCYLFAGEYATTRVNFNLINTLTTIIGKL